MPIQLECLESVLQAVSVLEAVVRRSFGPDGGQVLFTRDTGQTLLTRHGTCILTALRLEHPLARVVVECVRRHSSETGDGSKTFILLLASLLREIQKHTRKARQEAVGAKRLAEDLLAFGLDRLSDVISVGLAARGTYLSGTCYPTTHTDSHTLVNTDTCILQQLLGAFLHTRISPTHADVLSQLTFELLSHWSYRGSPINQHFPALHTTLVGFPIGCSRLLEGQVIHADFSTPLPVHDQGPIKALMVKEPMEPSLFIGGSVLELGGTSGGMESVNMRSARWLESVCVVLQKLGVSLLLSSIRQSEAALAEARRNGVCVLECVSEDDFGLFSLLSGSHPVSDWFAIGLEDVAMVTFCRSLVLGAHRFVHVGFPKAEGGGVPHSLVLCGLTEGQTEQSVCAIQDALCMLHAAKEPTSTTYFRDSTSNANNRTEEIGPGCVIPVGGTFEFLIHHALIQRPYTDTHTRSHSDTPGISRMLAEALLSVPREIYSHSPRRYLEAHSRAFSSKRYHFSCLDSMKATAVTAAGGSNVVRVEAGSGSVFGSVVVKEVSARCGLGVESVSSKYQLILAVLQCLRSVLCVDTLLHTPSHTYLHTCRREDEEDED